MTRDRAILALIGLAVALAVAVLALTAFARSSEPDVPILDQMCAEARAKYPAEGCW